MVSREILILGGALVGSEATGVTNLTGIGSSEDESESPEVPSIVGSVPSIDFSGIGKAFGGVGNSFSEVAEASSNGLSSLNFESPEIDLGLDNLRTKRKVFEPFDDSNKWFKDSNKNKNGSKNNNSGNLGNLDEVWWKNWEKNTKDVSEGVGGGLEEITLGTAEEFINEGRKRVIGDTSGGSPPTSDKSAKAQLEIADSAFDPQESISDGVEDVRKSVQKNKKKSSDSGGSSSGSSSGGSSGGSDVSFGSFSEPEPSLDKSEVRGKSEAEAQTEKTDQAFSIDKGNSQGSSGSKSNNTDSEGNESTKNKKKDDDGFNNPFLR